MKFIDTHAHYNDENFKGIEDETIKKCIDAGVDRIINVGYDVPSSIRSIELSNKYEQIYAAIGIHPHDVDNFTAKDVLDVYNTYYNQKIVAIGEIGLDYYYDNSPREVQKEWFKKQIELANELKLPIIIHDRDAHQDTFEIIKNTKSPEIGCVLHCYSGNVELAKEYVKMGCYISIPGTVTFKNNKKTREVAKEIPLEYLLIETDSPYMAPEPHRGKRNDPSLVAFVADKIAQEKGISYEKVCEATKENAKRLFNIK